MEGKHIPLSQVLKPDERSVIGRFKYLPDGRVASTEEEDAEVEATIEVFNLNTPKLVSRRKKLIEGLVSVLQVYAMWWLRALRSQSGVNKCLHPEGV